MTYPKPFEKLRALRAKLAAVPSHLCDDETREGIIAGIDELDDEMVASARLDAYMKATTPPTPGYHTEYIALFAGSATVNHEERVA